MASMSKEQAVELAEKIKRLCKAQEQWCKVVREYRPDLKNIIIEVSIKMD